MKNRLKMIAILSVVLFIALMGLLWLAAGLLLLSVVYYVFSHGKLAKWTKRNSFFASCVAFASIFVLAIVVRLFIFEIYNIPSASMEDTLIPGDKVIVSKLNYGPQLPRSPFEIPWVNVFFYITKEAKANPNAHWWNYQRLEGLSKISRGDIVVFESRSRTKSFLVKRCVGLPGEVLKIKDGEVFHDKEIYPSPATAKRLYQIKYNNRKGVNNLLDSLHLRNYWSADSLSYPYEIWLVLNKLERDKLRDHDCIDSILLKTQLAEDVTSIFPRNPRFKWTINNFGPLLIPAKGLTIPLNKTNIILYATILKKYEHVTITERHGRYYLNEIEIDQYTFQQNYYFMMGDHRDSSQDSRFWGFLPEENVVGKVVGVLYSAHDNDFKWNRLFKFSI